MRSTLVCVPLLECYNLFKLPSQVVKRRFKSKMVCDADALNETEKIIIKNV